MSALPSLVSEEPPVWVRPTTRVLVIDDDESVSAAIEAILVRRQYDVMLTSRAHAGIHAFEASRFDVVMVDIFMPGMSGLDTIAHIRRVSGVPIIAMSGFRLRSSLDPVDYLTMALQRGATVCLSKPFASAGLTEAIVHSLRAPCTQETTQ
jgi:DNA-binding response OmpR family regulator